MLGCSSLSTNSPKMRTIVFPVFLIVLLLIIATTYVKRSKFLGDDTRLERQSLSHSCATKKLALPAAASIEGEAERSLTSSLRNFTVVTAYLNIGRFIKGTLDNVRDSSTYLNWMWPYRFMRNGVVAYFDDASMATEFTELRRGLPTKVIMVDRSELWAFSLVDRTRAVFSQPDYPKSHPKSTNAEYVAAVNAKYELVARTIREDDSFGSSYIAWMDLGIYRQLPEDETDPFMLRASPCLHDDAIMYARIYPMVNDSKVQTVMRYGIDWVSGNFFIARRDVMTKFCKEYMQRVELYLNDGLANHDQSILLSMYLPSSAPRPSVPLQAVIPSGSDDPWFNMALQCRRDGLETVSSGQQKADGESAESFAAQASCTYEICS